MPLYDYVKNEKKRIDEKNGLKEILMKSFMISCTIDVFFIFVFFLDYFHFQLICTDDEEYLFQNLPNVQSMYCFLVDTTGGSYYFYK